MNVDVSWETFRATLGEALPAFGLTSFVIIACVLIHYEALVLFSRLLQELKAIHRLRLMLLILGLLVVHLVEIWIFAGGYYAVLSVSPASGLSGLVHPQLIDLVYFSAVTYTSVGYGEIVPLGPLRLMAAMEALSGLIIIGWSVAFTFIEMRRFWKD